jgi:hypothetical protein
MKSTKKFVFLCAILLTFVVSNANERKKKEDKVVAEEPTKQVETEEGKLANISTKQGNLKKDNSSRFFMSQSFSSFSNFGGKPEKHVKSVKTEEWRDAGEKGEEVRRYGESYEKNNDDPAKLKRKAATNVEEEEMILGQNPEEEKTLKNEEAKALGFEDNFFGNQKNNMAVFNPFQMINSAFSGGLFSNAEKRFNMMNDFSDENHGDYGKFLNEKKTDLINSVKSKKGKKKRN